MDLEIIKSLLIPAFVGLCGLVSWMWKKQHSRVDKLETRVTTVEKSAAVTQAIVDNIREDIRDIKQGIEKLVDRK